MIRFDGVSFSYPTAAAPVRALSNVDFCLAPGELMVVLGENGSGKSTLARLANGLLLPESGRVTVDDMSTTDEACTWEIRRRVGMVLQNPDNQIVATFVEEDVAFGPENLGVPREEIRERVYRCLAAVGLAGFERREPHQLSGGQKQRLAIAGAIAMEPAFLVLDEPTAMLDPQGRADVLAVLRRLGEEGRGILHITHDLTDAAHADRVLVVRQGSVAFLGSPEELFSDPTLPESFGLSLPPASRLAAALRAGGVPVASTAFDPESVVSALWP